MEEGREGEREGKKEGKEEKEKDRKSASHQPAIGTEFSGPGET